MTEKRYILYVKSPGVPRRLCSLTMEVTNREAKDTVGTFEEVQRVRDNLVKRHPKATYTISEVN